MAPFLQTFAAPAHTATKHPQGRQPPALCWCLFSSRQSPRGRQASQGTDFRMCEAGCRFNGLLPQAYRWRFKWQALQLFSMRNVKLKKKSRKIQPVNYLMLFSCDLGWCIAWVNEPQHAILLVRLSGMPEMTKALKEELPLVHGVTDCVVAAGLQRRKLVTSSPSGCLN